MHLNSIKNIENESMELVLKAKNLYYALTGEELSLSGI